MIDRSDQKAGQILSLGRIQRLCLVGRVTGGNLIADTGGKLSRGVGDQGEIIVGHRRADLHHAECSGRLGSDLRAGLVIGKHSHRGDGHLGALGCGGQVPLTQRAECFEGSQLQWPGHVLDLFVELLGDHPAASISWAAERRVG